MAQTLQVKAIVRSSTDGGVAGSDSYTVTTSGNSAWEQKGSVGTTEEEWTISTEVGDAGVCVIRNLDATNYVQIGFATTVYNLRVKAGESQVVRLEPTTASIFLKANTNPCVVQVKVWEA